MSTSTSPASPYLQAFNGSFIGMLRWEQLDALWERVHARADEGWYIYAVGEEPPQHTYTAEQVHGFIRSLNNLLRKEHAEGYCGIVYADDELAPRFIKVYDPNNLGAVCGSSGTRTLPGWTFSLLPPSDLKALPQTGQRRRWWQGLFKH